MFPKNKISAIFFLFFIMLIQSCQQIDQGPSVVQVYPTADTLPENLLRMYIQFSEPMKTVGNLEKISLINEEAKEIQGAIFNNVYELWDEQQLQLTLIFDPARVKTGLVAHNNMGRALQPNQSYQLVIDGLENIDHQPMPHSYTKRFFVTTADTIPPSINDWVLSLPKAQSKTPLLIKFPDMLDQISLRHRLVVVNGNEETIVGNVDIGKKERSWQFTPDIPWPKGNYKIYINARLEDPAGNNPNGLFDHKIGTLKYAKEGELLQIDFQIVD